jgi:DNA-binding transcriptional LysR family regulator
LRKVVHQVQSNELAESTSLVDCSFVTLDQIRIFLAVAERLHVTRAAEALHLTQSAVSAAIAALEAQHGVRLFDRVGRRIELTQAGTTFVDAARSLQAQAETTRLLLQDLARETRGRLRLFASQTVASYWLPARLMAFHDRHPDVELSLSVGNTAQAAQAVLEGTADLGFGEGDLPASHLRRQVFARDELVLVLARSHPAARQPAFTAQDYRGFRWLIREPGSGTRSEFETHLRAMGLVTDDLDVALVLPSNEAILAGVAASACVAMLSRRAVGSARNADLALRRVSWAARPSRPFAVLSHPERHRTRAVTAMLAIVLERESAPGAA